MIGYVTVGTNDLPRAAKFYDALAAEMGTARMMEFGTFIAWGTPGGPCGIAATKPYDGQAATVVDGVGVQQHLHLALQALQGTGGGTLGDPALDVLANHPVE